MQHMMRNIKKTVSLLVISVLLLSCLTACGNSDGASDGSAAGSASIDSVNIATQAVGTSYYAMGTGIAKIITDNTPIRATILPYAGPDAWAPEFKSGDIALEVISAMVFAFS